MMAGMSILQLVLTFIGALFKSQRRLALENLALRQQVAMLRQSLTVTGSGDGVRPYTLHYMIYRYLKNDRHRDAAGLLRGTMLR